MTENGASCELMLRGKLSHADGELIQSLIAEFRTRDISDCSIDLSELSNIDSSGLGMLMMVNDAAQDRGQTISLSGATGQVQKMLELSKFSQIVPIKS